MNRGLQIILFTFSLAFFLLIINMIRTRRVELRYALTWIFASMSFIVLSVFPDIIKIASKMLYIKEPVNTLFLFGMLFLLMIIFTLTVSFSSIVWKLKTLTQEIGILRMRIEELEKGKKAHDEEEKDS